MFARTTRLTLALLSPALITLLGCEGGAPLQNPVSAANVPLAAPAPLSASSGIGLDGTTGEVRTAFGEWVVARTAGDAAAFVDLYDTARFEGIHRARNGMEKRLGWRDWQAEQRPSSVPGESPHVLRPVFESWPGGTLDAATASVSFDEVSLTPTRGRPSEVAMRRVLVFGRGTDGKLRIVREEVGVATASGTETTSNSLSRDAKVARAMDRRGENP